MSEIRIPDRVRASVFVSPGEPLERVDFPRPELATGETLVRIACCTICGSDLHTYHGRRHGPTPVVLGHEMLGRVAAFGPGEPPRDWRGESLDLGDRVSWSVVASCGACYFCRLDLTQKCERQFKYGHEPCGGDHPLSGGLAEFCHLVRDTAIFRVPLEVPDAVAASANCALATAAAAHRIGGGYGDRTVLVQGGGLLGLAATAMAHVAGAKHVILADVNASRLATAKRFGASFVVNVAEGAGRLSHLVRQATDGRGVDVAYEMSGTADAFRQGMEVLRTGGCYVLVGAARPIGSVPLDVEQVVRRMWRIQGVHNYGPADLAAAIGFLAEHHQRFPFGELVSAVFPLEEADAALRAMADTAAIRVAVCP